jgi:hypothetical protein
VRPCRERDDDTGGARAQVARVDRTLEVGEPARASARVVRACAAPTAQDVRVPPAGTRGRPRVVRACGVDVQQPADPVADSRAARRTGRRARARRPSSSTAERTPVRPAAGKRSASSGRAPAVTAACAARRRSTTRRPRRAHSAAAQQTRAALRAPRRRGRGRPLAQPGAQATSPAAPRAAAALLAGGPSDPRDGRPAARSRRWRSRARCRRRPHDLQEQSRAAEVRPRRRRERPGR